MSGERLKTPMPLEPDASVELDRILAAYEKDAPEA
jgi:hypothetical protein